MGRAKQYDRNKLLDQSVELFRRHGFHGTTTAALVEGLGVNRKSMYAEFGSKQGLFEATLEHYDRKYLSAVLAPIEAPDAGTAAILRSFAGYARASEGRMSGLGCLLCNTAVERGALAPGSIPYVDAYLTRLTAAFRHTLNNAVNTGELKESTDTDELAAFFTMALIGVAACVRAESPPAQVHAACKVATGVLDSHRAG